MPFLGRIGKTFDSSLGTLVPSKLREQILCKESGTAEVYTGAVEYAKKASTTTVCSEDAGEEFRGKYIRMTRLTN